VRPAGRTAARFLAVFAAVLAAACASRKPPPPAARPVPSASRAAPSSETGGAWSDEGMASWYGGDDGFEGKPTASGELYDSSQLTAAHRELPLGSVVEVTSLDNGRVVRVRINDRGPFVKGRIIDLSRAAAQSIAMIGPGTARVRLILIAPGIAPTPVPAGTFWAVQVGSFGERPRADRHADRVRAAGFSVYFEPYQGLTRVKVGPLPTRDDAADALARLEQAGFEEIVVPANK
jgi:rare lipoprotein A